MTTHNEPKLVGTFSLREDGSLSGGAYAAESTARYWYGFNKKRVRGEPVRRSVGPLPVAVWFTRTIRGKGLGLAPYSAEDPTNGAGPYFVFAAWEEYTGVMYSMYEWSRATTMHETLAEAEARWKEVERMPMERLYDLVICAPLESEAKSAPEVL